MSLLIKQKQEPPKCAYCHDTLAASVYICDGCQTYYHTECLNELGRCAVLGCEKPFTGIIEPVSGKKGKKSSGQRRGPELSPRITSHIKGTKIFKDMTTGNKIEASLTIGLAVFCFVAFCYLLIYGLLWGFAF